MKRLLITILALTLFACSSAPDVPGESVAKDESALLCFGPAGSQAVGLTLLPAGVQRAHFLVNKMWGAWPRITPNCPGAWYCGTLVPNTCTAGQCAAGQCFGWTCQMTEVSYADDGLRLSTTVGGLAFIDSRFATMPSVGGLTSLETTELGAVRLTAGIIDDYWCSP